MVDDDDDDDDDYDYDDDDACGALGGMRTGRGNLNTWRKPACATLSTTNPT
jgi:hypothetical protein